MDKKKIKHEFLDKCTHILSSNNEYIKPNQTYVSFKKETVLTNLSYLNSNLNNSKSLIQLEPIFMTLNKRNHDIFSKSSYSENKIIKRKHLPNFLNSKYWSISFLEFENLELKNISSNLKTQNKKKTMIEGNLFYKK